MSTQPTDPDLPDAITTSWLTRTLRTAGVLGTPAVTSFVRQRIGRDQGFVGEVLRLTLRYDAPEPGAPASVVAKLPSAHPDIRAAMVAGGLYRREAQFYREVAPVAPIATPRCYHAGDPASDTPVLLLEDMTTAASGDDIRGATPAQAEAAVAAIARFHAHWWDRPSLERLTWLPSLDAGDGESAFRACWPLFQQRAAVRLPETLLAAGERLAGRLPLVLQRLAGPPRTFLHGDYRLDNMLFGAGAAPAVLDWQLAVKGRGAADLAYFLSFSLSPDRRRAAEQDLLRRYHEELLKGGVTGYSFAQCYEDYRAGVTLGLVRLVTAGAILDTSGRRARALALALIRRVDAALTDHPGTREALA